MTLNQIRCFLRSAETNSFTRAAALLYMSPQSVSKHVSALEADIGQELLDRSSSFLKLTEAGHAYYATFATADRQLFDLNQRLAGVEKQRRQTFRLGFSQWVTPFGAMSGALKCFRDKYPEVSLSTVQLNNDDLQRALEAGELDAAIFSGAQAPQLKSMLTTPIAQGDMHLYGPKEVVENASADSYMNCWGLPLLIAPAWEWSYFEKRMLRTQEMEEFGFHPKETLQLPNVSSLQAAMHFGNCVTVGDARFGLFEQDDHLASVSLPLEEIVVCISPLSHPHPLLKSFTDILSEYLAK